MGRRRNSDELRTVWVMNVAIYYGEEPSRDEMTVYSRIYNSEKDAILGLKEEIEHEWEARVSVDGKRVSLAKCRGKSESESVKYSEWFYAEDGKAAWWHYGLNAYHGYVTSRPIE